MQTCVHTRSRPIATKYAFYIRTLPDPRPCSTLLDPPKPSRNSLSPRFSLGGRRRRPPRENLGDRVQEHFVVMGPERVRTIIENPHELKAERGQRSLRRVEDFGEAQT